MKTIKTINKKIQKSSFLEATIKELNLKGGKK